MKKLFLSIAILLGVNAYSQTIPTSTVTGSLKINDSLNVTNNIQTAGDVSATGNITATGEVTAQDTMRAQKDLIVDGNAKIAGSTTVAGPTNLLGGLTVTGLNQATVYTDPCNLSTMLVEGTTGHVITVSAAAAMHLEDLVSASPCATSSVSASPTVPFTWQTIGNHVGNNSRWLGTYENFDFSLKTNSVTRAVFKKTGQIFFYDQVFIGIQQPTAHPNVMLSVDGKIACKSLYVLKPSGWADFVFKSNKLETLESVEKYIIEYKHLPNIPSEEDILKNGYDINEMDAKLLAKIETLYLHIIELEKEVKQLKNKD